MNHPGKRICFYSIEHCLTRQSLKLRHWTTGFSSCRLWPFNPDVFTEADFAPSMMTDDGNEHIASTSDATSPASPTTRATLPQAVASTSEATSPASPTTRATLPEAVASTSDATSPASPTTRATLPQAVASTSEATSPASPITRATLPQVVASTSDATSPASPTTRATLPQAVASTSDATSPASPSTRAKLPEAVTFMSDATPAPSKATACVTTIKAYGLSVFPLPKAGPRPGKRRTQSPELLSPSPHKGLLRSKQIKLGEQTKSRAGRLSVKKSDRRELHKGKRAPANGKSRQPLADRPKRRPDSGRTESVYRGIYCNEVYEDPPTEGWLQVASGITIHVAMTNLCLTFVCD